jgi:hypothetical protein
MTDGPIKIGITHTSLGGLDTKALKYLVLFQNTLQNSFEFQFLPSPEDDPLIELLNSSKPIDPNEVEQKAKAFIPEYRKWLVDQAGEFKLDFEDPNGFVILSTAKFADNVYFTPVEDLRIIALGHWRRYMSPPSIVEFFMTLLIAAAVDLSCGKKSPSEHYATKGCIFDLSEDLNDARWAVMTGFMCDACRNAILQVKPQQLIDDAMLLLKEEWLGDVKNPSEVADTAKKLGYDLFHTSGIKKTFRERVLTVVEEETTKKILEIAGAIILAALLLWLGLKGKN